MQTVNSEGKNNLEPFSKELKVVLLYSAKTGASHLKHYKYVPHVVPCKALGKFPKAVYRTAGGTCSARFIRPVLIPPDFL